MGLWTNLEIYQADAVVFTDLAQLNDTLINQGHGTFDELYADECVPDPRWQGVFIQSASGDIQIANRSEDGMEGYGESTSVWGCYDDVMWKAISDGMASGKFVLFIDCEEPSYNKYIVMEPGKFQVLDAKQFRPKF